MMMTESELEELDSYTDVSSIKKYGHLSYHLKAQYDPSKATKHNNKQAVF